MALDTPVRRRTGRLREPRLTGSRSTSAHGSGSTPRTAATRTCESALRTREAPPYRAPEEMDGRRIASRHSSETPRRHRAQPVSTSRPCQPAGPLARRAVSTRQTSTRPVLVSPWPTSSRAGRGFPPLASCPREPIAAYVLSGKRSLREAYTNPASTRVMNAQVHAFAERWAVLAEEEKAELGAESATMTTGGSTARSCARVRNSETRQPSPSTGSTRSPTVPRGRHRRRVIRQPASVRNHMSS